jgi:glycosyltransferase involved in cell wall biosynthesis
MTIILDARTATDHFPGIGRYVVNLAQALTQTPLASHLTLLHDPTAAATRLQLPALPQMTCPVSPFSLRQQWVVPAQLRRSGARLYHSAYYLMPYLPGLPTVLTCYDLLPLFYPQYYGTLQRLIYRLAHLLATQAASIVLAISEATRADLIRCLHLEPRKIVVTLLAADPRFQPQSPDAIAAVGRKYALPQHYVLYVGSNKPHKNLVRLVQAFGEARVPSVSLVIAGHWDARYPEAKQAAAQAGWQDRVKFIGPVAEADLPAMYTGARLFVFPSLYEGFGLPVLEAMACGAPVICSNSSSLPEVIGEAHASFDPLNTAAMAAVIQEVLGSPAMREELSRQGLQRAAQFSWTQTAQRTATVYQDVLARAA